MISRVLLGIAVRCVSQTRSWHARTTTVLTVLLLLLSVYVAACGGEVHTTRSVGERSTPATTTTGARAFTIPAKPYVEPRHQPSGSGSPSGRASHGLAGFRVAHGDNSVLDLGREASASQQRQATAMLAAFMRARARGEWAKMCPHIARATLRPLEAITKNGGCEPALAGLVTSSASERIDTFMHGITAMRIKANTAFVLFYGPNAGKYVMPMRSEDGAWKVTQLAPLPYPIGTSAATP